MAKTIDQYAGKWVAIRGKSNIIECGRTVTSLLNKIPKKELPNLSISKIPKKNRINIL